MNQYRLFRAVSVLLMLFSLLTAVSCRGGEDVPATTVAQTTVAVSEVTSETDPSAGCFWGLYTIGITEKSPSAAADGDFEPYRTTQNNLNFFKKTLDKCGYVWYYI